MSRPPQRPIAIDFFCGAGGLSLGFQQAGFRIVGGVDFDTHHIAAHAKNFPKSAHIHADICTLTAGSIRKRCGLKPTQVIDVVIGGPPCQGFSLIGKRNSRDPRNRLLGQFCRLIAELKPRYFILENVPGLLCGNSKNVLLRRLRKLSPEYEWVSPISVLNAAHFGVPQDRRRLFVLGYRRSEAQPEYPKVKSRRTTVWQAIKDLKDIPSRKAFDPDEYQGVVGLPSSYARSLGATSGARRLSGCKLCDHELRIRRRFQRTTPGAVEPISRFKRLAKNSLAPTLRAGTAREYGGFTAPRPIHPTQARCITVREAARLHSFPDSFQFDETQWHGFRQVGNSVPPRLARAVALQVWRALKAGSFNAR